MLLIQGLALERPGVSNSTTHNHPAALAAGWRSYLPLTKPTISLLVVVTMLPTMLLASSSGIAPALMVAAVVGTFLSSASASVFNHLLDADLDLVMNRTRGRPLPSGQVSAARGFLFGGVLAAFSLVVLYKWTTPAAAYIALLANIFYVLIYTLCLKRYTDQNIVIGGAAGAVGPLIGWAAVQGGLSWQAWVLFGIIFLWTPPHFWALAIKYQRDYAAAKVPMLPVTRGEDTTRKQIFIYTLTLIPAVASLSVFGATGFLFLFIAGLATIYFCLQAWSLLKSRRNDLAMPLFHYSCLYLFAVFGALALDRLIIVPL